MILLQSLFQYNYIMMKKSITGALCLFLALSCSPLTFNLGVEMRGPSKTGLSLGGKNLSVAYLDDGKASDSLFLASISEGFSQVVEKDYFGGEEVVDIYRIERQPGVDYLSKDVMVRLLVETDSDVTFLFDLESIGETSFSAPEKVSSAVSSDSTYFVEASTPFAIKLYVYDAMNVQDTVLVFNGKSVVKSPVYTDGDEAGPVLLEKAMKSIYEPGYSIGKQSAGIFLSTWQHNNFTLYYYDDSEWYKASQAAYDYKWTTAMDTWMSMLDTKDMRRRSCIEYNLAVVNCILGQKSIASQWLDRSDADYRLPESSDIRRKINKL